MIDARNYSAPATLADGTHATVRAIRTDDWDNVLAVFEALDRESIYTRFFAYKKQLSQDELTQIIEVDFERVVALVVMTPREKGEAKLIVGGRYAVSDNVPPFRAAELAFMTGAGYRGRGIASLLLKHLVRIGRAQGLVRFEAEVLAQNQAMLSVFRRSGLPIDMRVEGNLVHVILSLDRPPDVGGGSST